MQRKNFYLSNVEIIKLNKEADQLDIATSDLLRRIIDKHYEGQDMSMYAVFSGASQWSGMRAI